MQPNLLILGGTTEAHELAERVAENGIQAIYSYAGRVSHPKTQALPVRTGGFGGSQGLADFLVAEKITHIVDATHPFASQMSWNAFEASKKTGKKLLALTRPAWKAIPGDNWQNVKDIAGAVNALDVQGKRVFLAIGRLYIADFAVHSHHHYLLRFVDKPKEEIPLNDYRINIDRGPFTVEKDISLLKENRIELVVSKNSGGSGVYAKIAAARELGLPVVMIDRPKNPPRAEVSETAEVFKWLVHDATDLGV